MLGDRGSQLEIKVFLQRSSLKWPIPTIVVIKAEESCRRRGTHREIGQVASTGSFQLCVYVRTDSVCAVGI